MEHHQITRHNVPRETFTTVDELIDKHREKLEAYLDTLFWWNKKVNLISRDVSRGTVWEHIRHSLLLSNIDCFKEAENIVDAGTGGGLPGIPLAITHPQKHFILNDIVSKKVIAVRQILLKLNLENTLAKAVSIEKVDFPTPSLLISKHAFKINDLWKMVWNKPVEAMVFYKGINFENELEGIDTNLQIDVHDLSKESEFYQGKSIIVVKPQRS